MLQGTILLLNENERQRESMILFLTENDFKVVLHDANRDLITLIGEVSVDLVLLSIDPFEEKNLDLCQKLKNGQLISNVLVVVMSQRKEEALQLSALDSGADDFLFQPIAQRLFIKRISALLKRKPINRALKSEGLYIDYERFLVIKGNQEFHLPRKEFQLLALLFSMPDKVFTRDEIKRKLWHNLEKVKGRTIDVHIRKIREKVGEGVIITIQGMGYKAEVA